MTIQTILSGQLGNNTYIISNQDQVIIVDAAAPVELIKQYTQSKKVQAVLLTHGHFDHITYLGDILREFGCKCYMHKNTYAKLTDTYLNVSNMFVDVIQDISKDQVKFIEDQEILDIIGLNIQVVYTPGHTDCCVCYVINNKIFSGDTVFCDGVGRTDLPTSSGTDLKKSINKLFSQYKNCVIYPGHGETGVI